MVAGVKVVTELIVWRHFATPVRVGLGPWPPMQRRSYEVEPVEFEAVFARRASEAQGPRINGVRMVVVMVVVLWRLPRLVCCRPFGLGGGGMGGGVGGGGGGVSGRRQVDGHRVHRLRRHGRHEPAAVVVGGAGGGREVLVQLVHRVPCRRQRRTGGCGLEETLLLRQFFFGR